MFRILQGLLPFVQSMLQRVHKSKRKDLLARPAFLPLLPNSLQ